MLFSFWLLRYGKAVIMRIISATIPTGYRGMNRVYLQSHTRRPAQPVDPGCSSTSEAASSCMQIGLMCLNQCELKLRVVGYVTTSMMSGEAARHTHCMAAQLQTCPDQRAGARLTWNGIGLASCHCWLLNVAEIRE